MPSGTQQRLVRPPSWWRRWLPVVGLFLLSPFCAEYLVGYQGVIINPIALLVAVLFVAPIYGAPAVLIREITRRTGRGWPTMLLLATAAGLIQAGLVDQSLFNHAEFGDGPPAVRIPIVDVNAGQLVTFVVGHIVWSFCAPIAIVESLVPERSPVRGRVMSGRLGRPGDDVRAWWTRRSRWAAHGCSSGVSRWSIWCPTSSVPPPRTHGCSRSSPASEAQDSTSRWRSAG